MFSGVFINLDRSPDRRKHMAAELARFGLSKRYQRLRAVDKTPGILGCLESHLKALDYAASRDAVVHVLEDDSILSAALGPFLASRRAEELLDEFDIVFLDMWIDPFDWLIARYKAALASPGPMDMTGMRIACTSSYVVSRRSARKLLGLLKDAPPPIDVRYSDLLQARLIKAAVLVPFLTGVDIDLGSQSSIQSLSVEEMTNLIKLRTSFFAERDRQPSFVLADAPRQPRPGGSEEP